MNYSFIPDKCYVPIDLVFALDASGSVETSGFQQIKDFVKDIVNGFDIGVKDTHVGVLTFSEIGEVQIGLTDAFDKATLFDKIDNLNYPGYRTNTNDALEVWLFGSLFFFIKNSFARGKSLPKILIRNQKSRTPKPEIPLKNYRTLNAEVIYPSLFCQLFLIFWDPISKYLCPCALKSEIFGFLRKSLTFIFSQW